MGGLITKRQKELLRIIYQHIKTAGFPPTFEEMREKLKVSSNQSVIDLLEKLEQGGAVKRNEGSARSININPLGFKILGKQIFPVVGTSAAGAFMESFTDVDFKWMEIPSSMVPNEKIKQSDEVFIIKVSGDSMINAGINNEDMLLVRKAKEFKSGDIVDAVIFYQERVIPVDSKFSLENYNRLLEAKTDTDRKRFEDLLRTDLKNRIDETAKYIRPAEGTIEFAFMFIPSEALYYDLLVNKVGAVNARDLVEYAAGEKRVFIVSPTSFLAYLQTVIQGLRQVEINKSAEQIRKNIGELARHLGNYDAFLEKLGTHLGTSVNMYNKAYKEFGKIDKDVLRITGKPIGIEPVALDAPQQGEDTES